MWGNLNFLHNHDKFNNLTKSLKITQFGASRLFLHKISLFFSKKIELINPKKNTSYEWNQGD